MSLNGSVYGEEVVRALQQENKKLREANDTFTLGAKRTIESNCKLYQENKELKEQLNEESQERLKNKECWMSVQKSYHELKEENKTLKDEQLTEENAIRYVYENTFEYDDWVKGSEVYKELEEKNKKHNQAICREINERVARDEMLSELRDYCERIGTNELEVFHQITKNKYQEE